MEMLHPSKRRRGHRGRVATWVEKVGSFVPGGPSLGRLVSASGVFLVITAVVFLLLPESLPGSVSTYFAAPVTLHSCSPSTHPFLDSYTYCTGECNRECFPRVQNICFASDKVRLCSDPERSPVPSFMRFFGEMLTVGVGRDGDCNPGWHWVSGLSLVMDQRFLPAGKPNPHHEAEKLIPAILLKQFLNRTANLQWFASKSDISTWGTGLLAAVGLTSKVRYHTLPVHKDDSICFTDAVLFSAPTHVRYMPDAATNAWLRRQVLSFCNLNPGNVSSWPGNRAVVVDRRGGSRRLANKLEAGRVMKELLQVPVVHRSSGVGSFCDQVRTVADDEFFLVPHGSQNVNFLFAKPGAVVVEAFPYLYHTDAFRNFTYASGVEVYPLLGGKAGGSVWIRILALLGWDGCFKWRPCKNYARGQPLHVDLVKFEDLIRQVQKKKSPLRAQLGW